MIIEKNGFLLFDLKVIAILDYKNNLFPFIVGIAFGFVLSIIIYFLILTISVKRNSKITGVHNTKYCDEQVNIRINEYRNLYLDECTSRKLEEKIKYMKEISWLLVNDIARIYYPNAKYPLLELTIHELIELDYYIMERIEKLFSGKVLSKVKKLKISSIVSLVDMKKKIDNNKVVKLSEKYKVKPILKGVVTTLNFLNPYYWIKKLMVDIPTNIVINKIFTTIIEIIGIETSNVYSRRYVNRNAIDDEILEIENLLGDDVNE